MWGVTPTAWCNRRAQPISGSHVPVQSQGSWDSEQGCHCPKGSEPGLEPTATSQICGLPWQGRGPGPTITTPVVHKHHSEDVFVGLGNEDGLSQPVPRAYEESLRAGSCQSPAPQSECWAGCPDTGCCVTRPWAALSAGHPNMQGKLGAGVPFHSTVSKAVRKTKASFSF